MFASFFPTLFLLIATVFAINYGLECFTNLGIAYIYHSAHTLFEYKLVLVILKLGVKHSLVFYTPSEHSTDIRVTQRHSGRVLAYMSKKIGLPSLIKTIECLAVVELLDLLESVASPLLYLRVIMKLFVKLLGVRMSCSLHLVI